MPHEVASALTHELGARAASVFVLEHLHWADEATLDVLRLVARRAATVPALVVVTYRDDQLDNAHPLRRVLGELATTNGARRLGLSPLSRAAVARLAGPHDVDANELYRKTAGNPFFVVEALAAGAEDIPGTVRDAVLARAAPLSPAARAVLGAVAVVPPQAELWLLEAIAGEAVDGADECVASGMLVPTGDGVAFRHELARLAVEGAIGPSRNVGLHRNALAALAAPPSGALTWPGSPITPRRRPTPVRSYVLRPPPSRVPRRAVPTGRPPLNTGASCALGTGFRWASGPSCTNAGRASAI